MSNAKSSTSSAPSSNTPVPQNGGPDGEAPLGGAETGFELAHLEDADRGVEALDRDREAGVGPGRALPHALHAMNRSKPSTVVGGGEMNRATSSVVSIARSDGASEARSSRRMTPLAGQHRQACSPVGADDRLRVGLDDLRVQLLGKASSP